MFKTFRIISLRLTSLASVELLTCIFCFYNVDTIRLVPKDIAPLVWLLMLRCAAYDTLMHA